MCGDALLHALPTGLLLSLAALAAGMLVISHWLSRQRLFGVSLHALLAITGCLLLQRQLAQADFPFTGKAGFYKVVIHSQPEAKARSLLCPSLVLECGKNDTVLTPAASNKQFLLYLPPDSAARSLQRGDILWIHARLAPPANQGLPDEFDYARFLRLRGYAARPTCLPANGRKPDTTSPAPCANGLPTARPASWSNTAARASKATNWPSSPP